MSELMYYIIGWTILDGMIIFKTRSTMYNGMSNNVYM